MAQRPGPGGVSHQGGWGELRDTKCGVRGVHSLDSFMNNGRKGDEGNGDASCLDAGNVPEGVIGRSGGKGLLQGGPRHYSSWYEALVHEEGDLVSDEEAVSEDSLCEEDGEEEIYLEEEEADNAVKKRSKRVEEDSQPVVVEDDMEEPDDREVNNKCEREG